MDRDLGKTFTRDIDGQLASVLASNEKRNLTNDKFPTLFMYRVKGEKKKGWDDCPFWVPVFVFPNDKNYLFITNLY